MLKHTAIKAALEGFWFTGAHRAARPVLGGLGVIFTLHRVLPEAPRRSSPNRILTVTPEFLDATVGRVQDAGFDIVSLDEVRRRLCDPAGARPFAAFTFDDGYRDNLTYAWPVMQRRRAPFAVYVTSAYPDGGGELWWLALEDIIAGNEVVDPGDGGPPIPARTAPEKALAWDVLYRRLRAAPEAAQREAIRALAARHGFDLARQCRELVMTWDELRTLRADPLVTIGAHTVDHLSVAKLDAATAEHQMRASADRIERELGARPRHFSYPYGSRRDAGPRDFALAAAAGFETAVTTRPGLIYPGHAAHLTALPRLSLNGDYQSLRYLDVFLSGLPFFLLNRFERLNVA